MADMTLTDFLLARIDEDEMVARAASHQKVAGPFHGHWQSDSALLMANGALESSDRSHIARHDPARVLAECDAKRRIVEMSLGAMWPEYQWVVQELAAVHADHPDYHDEWRA